MFNWVDYLLIFSDTAYFSIYYFLSILFVCCDNAITKNGRINAYHCNVLWDYNQEMYCSPGEHNPPHVHAYYQDCKAIIDIKTCELSEGNLPSKQRKQVWAWAEIYQEERWADWEQASNGEFPFICRKTLPKNSLLCGLLVSL